MKNKYLAFILILVMSCTTFLTGCGNKQDNHTVSEDTTLENTSDSSNSTDVSEDEAASSDESEESGENNANESSLVGELSTNMLGIENMSTSAHPIKGTTIMYDGDGNEIYADVEVMVGLHELYYVNDVPSARSIRVTTYITPFEEVDMLNVNIGAFDTYTNLELTEFKTEVEQDGEKYTVTYQTGAKNSYVSGSTFVYEYIYDVPLEYNGLGFFVGGWSPEDTAFVDSYNGDVTTYPSSSTTIYWNMGEVISSLRSE